MSPATSVQKTSVSTAGGAGVVEPRPRGRLARLAGEPSPTGERTGRSPWPAPGGPPASRDRGATGAADLAAVLATRGRRRVRTVAVETVPAAALQLEASSRSGKPPVRGVRRQVGRTTAPGLGGDGAEAPVGGPADPDPGPVCTWCGIGRRGSLRATKGTDQIPPKYAGRRFHHAGRGGHAPHWSSCGNTR